MGKRIILRADKWVMEAFTGNDSYEPEVEVGVGNHPDGITERLNLDEATDFMLDLSFMIGFAKHGTERPVFNMPEEPPMLNANFKSQNVALNNVDYISPVRTDRR